MEEGQPALDDFPDRDDLATAIKKALRIPAEEPKVRNLFLNQRVALEEIIVTVDPGVLHLKLHWKGGDHTMLGVVKNRTGQHRWKTSATTEQLIRDLARLLSDGSIASVLNRRGIRTAKGHTWTQQRVCLFRNDHNIAVYRDDERVERGELLLHEAANRLGVSKTTADMSSFQSPLLNDDVDISDDLIGHLHRATEHNVLARL
jgi:hypothetical protein